MLNVQLWKRLCRQIIKSQHLIVYQLIEMLWLKSSQLGYSNNFIYLSI